MKAATLVILGLLLVGMVATGAFAFGNGEIKAAFESGNYEDYLEAHENTQLSEEDFNERVEKLQERKQHREEVKTAIESEDYDAFVSAIEDIPRADRLSVVTEENFGTFVEMHNALQNKDFETAKELAEELGLEKPEGKMAKHGKRMFGQFRK